MEHTNGHPGRHRVVIVGAGYGGLAAAQRLRDADVDVTVVDRTNHHLFPPLLYQAATGLLSEGDIAPPIRDVLRRQGNATVLLGEVDGVDLGARRLSVATLGQRSELGYDSLILATGSQQSYFGHPEYARDAPGMKTIDHALELRGRIFGAFEMAERELDRGHGRRGSPSSSSAAGRRGSSWRARSASSHGRCAATSAASTRRRPESCSSMPVPRSSAGTRCRCSAVPHGGSSAWGSSFNSASWSQAWMHVGSTRMPTSRRCAASRRPRRSGPPGWRAHRSAAWSPSRRAQASMAPAG